jgi:hypothetical protein
VGVPAASENAPEFRGTPRSQRACCFQVRLMHVWMVVAPLPVGRLLSLGCFGPLVVLLVLLLQIPVPRRVLTIGPHVFRMILSRDAPPWATAALGSISMHRLHVSFHSPPSANSGHTKTRHVRRRFRIFHVSGWGNTLPSFMRKGSRAEGRITPDDEKCRSQLDPL